MDTSWQILVFGQKNGLMRQAFRLVLSWPWRWQGRGVVPWVPDWRIWRDEWLLIEGEISINVYEHLWKYLLIPYHTEEKYLWTYLLMIMMIILMSAGFLGCRLVRKMVFVPTICWWTPMFFHKVYIFWAKTPWLAFIFSSSSHHIPGLSRSKFFPQEFHLSHSFPRYPQLRFFSS